MNILPFHFHMPHNWLAKETGTWNCRLSLWERTALKQILALLSWPPSLVSKLFLQWDKNLWEHLWWSHPGEFGKAHSASRPSLYLRGVVLLPTILSLFSHFWTYCHKKMWLPVKHLKGTRVLAMRNFPQGDEWIIKQTRERIDLSAHLNVISMQNF